MKRIFAFLLALIMVTALMSTYALADDGLEEMTMKMHMNCGTSDYVYTAGEKFAELVNEKTDGKVTIELYPNSALGTSADCIEGLSIGICNIVFDPIDNLAAWSKLANLNAAPYLYSSIDHYRAVWEGEVGKKILEDIGKESGKVLLGAGLQGVRVTTTNTPVYSVEDVKGLKLRVPTSDMYIDTWSWLGATPTPIAAADAFTAIQQGQVDGQENPYGASVGLSMQDCCKYVTETNHVYGTDTFTFDETYFNNLPEEYQTAIAEAADEATKYLTDLAIELTEEKKQVFVDAGCTIIETDISEWMDAMDGFLEEKYPYLMEYAELIAAADPAAE